VQRCGAASGLLGLVTLFVEDPPRENRNYTAMGSRKVRFQPLTTMIIAVRPAPALAAVALAIVVLSCICKIYPTDDISGCQPRRNS